MHPWVGMVLDVVPIVEQHEVVHGAVIAGGPARVLVVAVQPAQDESTGVPRQIDKEKKARRVNGKGAQNPHDEPRLQRQLAGNVQGATACCAATATMWSVMGEMALAPERLRK